MKERPASRRAGIGTRGGLARLVGGGLLVLAAAAIVSDRPGLRASFVTHVGERTVWRPIDPMVGIDQELASAVFRYWHQFGVRWSGWIDIAERDDFRFRIRSSGPVRFAIDGEELIPVERLRQVKHARATLERGPHRVEIDFENNALPVFLTSEMRPPQSDWRPFPASALYPHRPGPWRRMVRRLGDRLGVVGRRLVATGLVFLATLLVVGGGFDERAGRRLRSLVERYQRLGSGARRALGLALPAALALTVGLAVFPRTGSPFGWDDVRYLDLAVSGESELAYLNRYAHVYLLKPFIWIAGGDAFLGARIFWSTQLGLMVVALAVAARSLGSRRQIATFVASLFFLLCQPLFFLRAGASVPDTTVATLVMISVALYLDRRARGSTGKVEWQVLAIGAMTVWAIKSKELGAILLWLPVLLAFEGGRLDARSLLRKAGFWLVGAAAGLALLTVLDGVFFGDPLHGLRPSNQSAVRELNFAAEPQQSREAEGWLDVVREGRTPVAGDDPRMVYMALLVVLAALAAAHRGRAIELRLLHLMPILFLLLLTLIHVRATYVFLARYLYPIVPLSCFLVAAGFHHLGLDEISWRDLRAPRALAALFAVGFLLFGLALPYQAGRLPASEFLPAAWLSGIGWTSLDAVVELVVAPALALGLVIALALAWRHRVGRLLLVATLVVLALGLPFRRTLQDLGMSRPWQRGEAHLHPLRMLGDEIPTAAGVWVEISPSFPLELGMFGDLLTAEEIVKLHLDRRDLRATTWPTLDPEQNIAFLTRGDYHYWQRIWPALEESVVWSPGGELAVVFPSRTELPVSSGE